MFQMQWREISLRAFLGDAGSDAEGESQNVESRVQSLLREAPKDFLPTSIRSFKAGRDVSLVWSQEGFALETKATITSR
jgi:hypothetical protein